ncbi:MULTISPECIES: SPFH domain-containing protein [unclassified Brevibacterium]|uniref:flotillin family protein n=1 Tax=unclassified Brevibacterium TaxID=2614124 RepID=UPI0010F91265|nr:MULTISPECIES: SPFH domain-containing protein [unclassified Brevibacterium]MCM1011069.1 SPFH domain-containing protein [Brevibacterium sp. XM4083]
MDLILGAVIIGAIAIVVLIALVVILRSYKIASPSEALIITGRNASGASGSGRIIIGGRAVVYPIVQKAFILSLSSRQISVEIDGISKNGIALKLRGVAQVKVGGTDDDVRKAAQRFLDQQDQIDHYSKEILSGTLRAVVGTLTVEQIIQDRASFAAQVQEESAHSMNNQGLVIDTFQISAVEDEGSYLRDWGRPQAAEVAKNAAIAEANASRAAAVEEAQQNEETQKQQALTDQAIAEQQQQLALRRAALKEEADQRQATADNAGPLAAAAEKQKLLERDRVVAKEAAELRAEQLDAEVRRPADAERYRQQAEADARAYEIEAQGRAEAAAELHRRSKEAEAIRLEGQAEADAIKARGEAEAGALEAQAEAYKKFNDAAVLSKVLEVLPDIAGELVAPYANIKDLSIVSTDGESKLANSVSNNLAQVLEVVRGTTGIDLTDLVDKAQGGGSASGDGDDDADGPGSGGPDSGSGSGSGGSGGRGQVIEGRLADDTPAARREARREARDSSGGRRPGSGGTGGRAGERDSGQWAGFDPKDFLDPDGGLDIQHIGDEVKRATGIDVQAYIDEALRRRDGGAAGGSAGSGAGTGSGPGSGPAGGPGSGSTPSGGASDGRTDGSTGGTGDSTGGTPGSAGGASDDDETGSGPTSN